ncbi:hypothetical protein C0Q70_04311 [Pomacea canaliculata]|uniref:Alternative oxidase n=1 Tax=Pomacea canaliculata TaxID=400727 RepID=A0A2T7PV64_POMCA|nr:hypothetical protein C0Q70_04311 [Pomacea canaliculata]
MQSPLDQEKAEWMELTRPLAKRRLPNQPGQQIVTVPGTIQHGNQAGQSVDIHLELSGAEFCRLTSRDTAAPGKCSCGTKQGPHITLLSLIPLFVCVGTGVAGAAYYLLRLSTRNPDVSWKRDEVNEYPWNAYKPTDQYKVQSSHRRTLATKDTREEVMPKYKGGDFKVTPDPSHIDHFKTKKERKEESERSSPCRTSMNESPPAACKTFDREPACDNSEAECVTVTHRQPHGMLDKVALSAARGLNQAIVYIANYNKHIKTNEQIWLSRITIYEALNAVPPSVAASVHHVTSILLMRFDYGAIHGLIEEAKDEQMHLFAALQAKKASIFLRLSVLLMQGVFIPIYTVFYVICPKMCHRFTAYLDEESVAAYTECLREIKDGQLAEWRCAPAPPCAKKYWKLSVQCYVKRTLKETDIRNKSERKVKVAEEGERSQQGAQQVQGVQNVPGVDGEQSVQGAQGHINEEPPMGVYAMPHPIWTEDQLHDVKVTHKPPEGIVDRLALITVKTLRGCFDVFSGFKTGQRTDAKWLNRIIFLETVAAVPGMVAAMVRHMKSLRWMQRDHGWIHTLLEEAENERMHLMTALQLKQPSTLFRMSVIGVQGVFVTMFFVWYAVSPRFCHRFVGYLEEEAVKTYSKCLEDMEHGSIIHWKTLPAPPVAINYWRLPENAKLRDVILAIRADEAHHRVVNHTLASLKKDEFNPYKPGH